MPGAARPGMPNTRAMSVSPDIRNLAAAGIGRLKTYIMRDSIIPDRVEYVYDFGGDWRHVLDLEDPQPLDAEAVYPVCAKTGLELAFVFHLALVQA